MLRMGLGSGLQGASWVVKGEFRMGSGWVKRWVRGG